MGPHPRKGGKRIKIKVLPSLVLPSMTRSRAQEAPAQADQPVSFETAIDELESLVEAMEGGQLSLEQSLSAYKRGAELVTFCRKSLSSIEQQVRILEADLLKPFEPRDEES